MSDNRLPGSEDDEDTRFLRPTDRMRAPPLAQRMAAQTAPPAPLAPMPQPLPLAETEETEQPPAAGANPLIAAAARLLRLLGSLRNTSHPPHAGDLRERTIQEIRVFEQRARAGGVSADHLNRAHYALCASLDDAVLNTPWGSASGWAEQSLVSTFHPKVSGVEPFFDLLRRMKNEPGKYLPVIELMYLCLSFGFAGRYRDTPDGVTELEILRDNIGAIIARQHGPNEASLSPHWQGIAAPYRPSRPRMPVWVAGSIGAAAVGGLFLWFSTTLNAASDTVYDRMLAKPWDKIPAIAPAAVVRLPAPPPLEPSLPDRLRTALKPEIQQGLVSVAGTQTVPVIRIGNAALFAPGGAVPRPEFKPLIERIGAVLGKEPGRVAVIGYTDNQPVHSVQFPSNFQLSLARARAAKTVIAGAIDDPARVIADGRGDADPIASNATAAGREQNQRLEVVLYLQSARP